MRAALLDQGWTEQSRVTVLADGADDLQSAMQGTIRDRAESVLDWFYISTRLRPS